MEENRIPKGVLYMNLGTTRLRGRPRNRWQDGVRGDGRLVGGERWQENVHNREEWKKLLRAARNRPVLHMPMEWMNSFIHWGSMFQSYKVKWQHKMKMINLPKYDYFSTNSQTTLTHLSHLDTIFYIHCSGWSNFLPHVQPFSIVPSANLYYQVDVENHGHSKCMWHQWSCQLPRGYNCWQTSAFQFTYN